MRNPVDRAGGARGLPVLGGYSPSKFGEEIVERSMPSRILVLVRLFALRTPTGRKDPRLEDE